MKRRAVAFTLLWLWFLSPAVVRAESRALDFSSGTRSARLLDRGTPLMRGWAGGNRVRALSSASVTGTEEEPLIPTHVWLVPLILTGAGFITGLALCVAAGAGDRECDSILLGGLALGAAAGLTYLLILACAGGACSEECTEEDEDCVEVEEAAKRSRSRAARDRPALPLGLAPTVGFVNDRAVFGLGGHF